MRSKENLSLGNQIDRLYVIDSEIDTAEATVRELKRKRAKMETRLLNDFEKNDIDGAKGKFGTSHIQRGRHPHIKDRKSFFRYLIKHRATDLLHARIASKAYFDRLDEGETIPGVEIYNSIRVSIRKRKR